MIVRRFLQWAATAPASQRADGTAALADAFLHADLDDNEREEAEIALTAMLDDPSPLVRKTLADVLGPAAGAPHALVVALANDQSDIAAAALRYSPLLSDSDLIDCVAIGDAFAQSCVALRAVVAAPVAAAIAEVGQREALIALAVNPFADIPEFAARRMVARFGSDAELREGLLARHSLPGVVRSDLVGATAGALEGLVRDLGWLSPERMARVVRESCDRAHLIIAADADPGTGQTAVCAFVTHLRDAGRLTPSLILRAMLSGNRPLYEAALTVLSGLPERKALALLRGGSSGLATLYRAANMPPALLPAFAAALAAALSLPADGPSARLSRAAITRVIASCETINAREMNTLLALLRRFEAEAAREDARDAVVNLRAPSIELLPSVDPYRPPPARLPRVIQIDLARLEADLLAA